MAEPEPDPALTESEPHEPRRVPWPAFVVGVLWAGALMGAVVLRAGDVSAPLHIGGPHVDRTLTPADIVVQPANRSYDGQFFYRLSVAPFSDEQWEHGIQFDVPALRASRILYPLVVGAASLGNDSWVPPAMLIVNVIAAGVVALGAALLAQRAGRHWSFGLVVLVIPGVTYGLAFALADVVAIALALFALVAILDKRPAPAAVLLLLAALTRESTLLIAASWWLGTLLHLVRARDDDPRPRRLELLAATAPFVGFAAWQLVIYAQWHQVGLTSSGRSNFAFPFSALLGDVGLFVPRDGTTALRCLVLLTIAATTAGALATLRSRPGPPPFVTIGLALGVLVFVSLGQVPFSNYPNFSRAATELLLMAFVAAVGSRAWASRASLLALGTGGVTLAAWAVWATTPV